jgi:hypothetical protein
MTGILFRAYVTLYLIGLVALVVISHVLAANGLKPTVSFWYSHEVSYLAAVISENLRLLGIFLGVVAARRFLLPKILPSLPG